MTCLVNRLWHQKILSLGQKLECFLHLDRSQSQVLTKKSLKIGPTLSNSDFEHLIELRNRKKAVLFVGLEAKQGGSAFVPKPLD